MYFFLSTKHQGFCVIAFLHANTSPFHMFINLRSCLFVDLTRLSKHIYKGVIYSSKDWEPTFLIGAFGLSEEISTEVGFAFSNNGLKSQDLQFGMKKYYMIFLIMFHDFRFGLRIVTTHLTCHCLIFLFQTKNCIIE